MLRANPAARVEQQMTREYEEANATVVTRSRKPPERGKPTNADKPLDPYEVFNDLPKDIRMAIANRDVARFQQIITSLPHDEGWKILDRCVRSKIWAPAEPLRESYYDIEGSASISD